MGIEYLAPETIEEALENLRMLGKETRLLAGGTDLIPRIRSGLITPSTLIDLRKLPLDYINVSDHLVCIGACTTQAKILESSLIARHLPLLAEAAREIAGPPVRNRGTLGGNLANASPAADFATPLLVYDAQVILKSVRAERAVPIDSFFTHPGKAVMADDEILTEVRIPLFSGSAGTKFIKLGKRKAMSIAVVSVAARLALNSDGIITDARLAFGSVAPTPIRAKSTEAFLVGAIPSQSVFAQAGEMAAAESSPISDIRGSADYRRAMVSVLSRRALTDAWNKFRKDSGYA